MITIEWYELLIAVSTVLGGFLTVLAFWKSKKSELIEKGKLSTDGNQVNIADFIKQNNSDHQGIGKYIQRLQEDFRVHIEVDAVRGKSLDKNIASIEKNVSGIYDRLNKV